MLLLSALSVSDFLWLPFLSLFEYSSIYMLLLFFLGTTASLSLIMCLVRQLFWWTCLPLLFLTILLYKQSYNVSIITIASVDWLTEFFLQIVCCVQICKLIKSNKTTAFI